nr:glycosyltransferase [Lichenihabitans sp. Uapishka_5]
MSRAEPLRLCLATDSREPSGVGEHMLALALALRDRFAVVLACPDSSGGAALLARAARGGVGVKRLDDDPEATRAWLAASGFDILHLHAGIGWEAHGLARLGREAGVPYLLRTEHLPDLVTDPEQRLDHAAGLALVDRLICVSEAAAASFRARLDDPGKLTVVPNGHPTRPAGRERAAVRQDFGIDDARPVLLNVARFTPQKDHATLIAALPALLRRHPDAELWLAGTGPLEAATRQAVVAAGLDDAVRFLGHRSDVPDLLAAADLFVLPSRFEGLPLAVLEAMAAGRAVVATAVGGTDEAVADGHTGRLVPPGDPAALANAIAATLAPGCAQRFGDAGRVRYAEAFTAARMADDTATLYRGLDPGPPRRTRMARTRLGFIGAGGIAHRHMGVLQGFEDVEFAAFADPAEERAREAAERFGARAYADFNTMLAKEELDALYICVPPFAHGAPERAALAKKLPFFVEKPVALDLALAEEIAAAVAAAGLVTGVGYHWRYLDTLDEARAVLADNPAQFLSGYWLDSTPPPQWWWKNAQSGGQMNEQTTHIIDLARYLVGDVVQVFGLHGHKARPDFPGLDVPTVSTASLKFASGAVANIGSTCLLGWNHRVGLHVFADRLAMEVTDHNFMLDVGHGRPYRGTDGDPVWREDRDFIDAVRGGENRIRCPYGEALATLRVTDAIRRSAETGQAVTLAPEPSPTVKEAAHV